MEISLRKATAIQNSINEAVKGLNFDYTARISEYEDSEKVISELTEKFNDSIRRRERLLEALYAIRKNVGTANLKEGIDIRMADAAHLEKQIQFYTPLFGARTKLSQEVIDGKLSKIKNADSNSRLYRDEVIDTSIFSQQDLTNFKSIVNFARKKRQKIQDEILELNVKTTITITSEVEKTLKDEGIL
jgi:hypothetical protein